MFLVKAALVTNHPELGIRVQPYQCAPTLDAVALQFSLVTGTPVKPRAMRWLVHGNLLFIFAPQPGYRVFHFSPCEGHELEFFGPTLVFYCPMSKQDAAAQLSHAGSWKHIAADFKPGDEQNLQPLFSHGRGTVELPSTKNWLTAVGDPARRSGARERAEPAPQKFGEGDDLTEMFEMFNAIGFDTKLIQMGDEVVGLMAMGKDQEPPMIERELCEDPGFYADRPKREHSVRLGIMAEVSFDPVHYPSPASFVVALMAGYCRALHLNINADLLEPEYANELLQDVHALVEAAMAQRKAEPVLGDLESPLLAKMPDEEGGLGR